MAQRAADTESIRRSNRALVLEAVRREGVLSRSRIATITGLSNAALSAIGADLVAQGLLREVEASPTETKARGRPAIGLAHRRDAAAVALVELDVNRCRLSLVDYGGVLLDRTEHPLPADPFATLDPRTYLGERIAALLARSPQQAARLASVSLSVQGALTLDRTGLQWSPIRHFAGLDLTTPLADAFGVPVDLYKRGKLLADGTPWIFPELFDTACATVFIGSTVGMGLSLPTERRAPTDIGTEFGHMNHIPGGALCRCGARGCLEAYLADYGVLRARYGVPDRTPPAQSVPAADFQQIIAQAQAGDRNARLAFTLAGEALGHGIGRVMAMVELTHLLLTGPGTAALPLMRQAFEEAIRASLPGRIAGVPHLVVSPDASETIFRGLTMNALIKLDRDVFAPLAAPAALPSSPAFPRRAVAEGE